jgi:hypothetical protein
MENEIVAQFEIPEEMAKELSGLLTESAVKKGLLIDLVEMPARYEIIEKLVIALEDKITAIKNKITSEYVPQEYRTVDFSWNYDGYVTAGKTVHIFKNN